MFFFPFFFFEVFFFLYGFTKLILTTFNAETVGNCRQEKFKLFQISQFDKVFAGEIAKFEMTRFSYLRRYPSTCLDNFSEKILQCFYKN